MIKQEVQKL